MLLVVVVVHVCTCTCTHTPHDSSNNMYMYMYMLLLLTCLTWTCLLCMLHYVPRPRLSYIAPQPARTAGAARVSACWRCECARHAVPCMRCVRQRPCSLIGPELTAALRGPIRQIWLVKTIGFVPIGGDPRAQPRGYVPRDSFTVKEM